MPRHKLIRFILVAAAPLVLAAASTGAPATAPARPQDAPDDAAARAAVVAALKQRQHQLRNIRYTLRETVTRSP